jgi:hypothetical protein
MARFGQSFLASLTQPSYGQGLFELGGAIGGAPAAAAEKKRRDAMMEQIAAASGDPIKLAELQVQVAKTPKDLIEAQKNLTKLKQNQLKTQGQQSISVAQQVFAAETKPENLSSLTRSIEQVALQTGNDPIQAVADARAARQTALEAKETAIKEGFTTAYYASLNTPEQNEALLKNMRESGFSDLALDLETKNENFIELRDKNIQRQNENKPLTQEEINKLSSQVALIDDEATRKRYEAAVDTLSVTASNAPKKAREKFGQLLTDIAKISPEQPKEEKEKLLPDPSQDERKLALADIKSLRSNALIGGDETALGSITLNDGREVLIDDILDGDVSDDEGNAIDMNLNDLARVVAAQQKQNPEIKIDVAIKRAAESLVLGKQIGKKGATVSGDDVVDFGTLK